MFFKLFLLFIVFGIIFAVVFGILALAAPVFLALVILIAVMYFLAVIIIFSVADSVFNTALYAYAATGQVPKGYSKEIMSGAFVRK